MSLLPFPYHKCIQLCRLHRCNEQQKNEENEEGNGKKSAKCRTVQNAENKKVARQRNKINVSTWPNIHTSSLDIYTGLKQENDLAQQLLKG